MNRRARLNHALDYAIEIANRENLPLLVYEALTCSYPKANDRLHTFILEGVPENAKRLRALGAGYIFYFRRKKSDPNDAFYQVAEKAFAVVTDDYPVFVAARHNTEVSQKVSCPYFVVDSSCIVPMNCMEKREYAAYTIRPKIQRLLSAHLLPLKSVKLKQKWKASQPFAHLHTEVIEEKIPELVASSQIDHSVPPSLSFKGGSKQAEKHLKTFLQKHLFHYAKERNEPSAHATSNMSPYLHFGHISSLEIALSVKRYAEEHKLISHEYLEELIVRRELAFNYARSVEKPDALENLPEWARKTLKKHARDRRDPVYTPEQFERGETHDALWNACQRELLLTGKIHGYYRMYWGKKIIEWSATCQEAFETMVDLHDRYALDGRDPNTYTNILWCFGLHDRPWVERPIFGQVRWMSLDGMKRKTDVDSYLKEIAEMSR